MKLNRLAALGVAAALALTACSGDAQPAANAEGKDSNAGKQVRLWLVGPDTPQEVRDYAVAEFKKATGAELVIEEQVWEGLVDRLTTALSGSDSPDIVEVGNTQAVAFTSAGAFEDISDRYDELGGDDLLAGFVDAGSYDGKFFAAPYYAGSRLVFYRKDLLQKSGLEVPQTLEDYVAAGEQLKGDIGRDDFSGIYFPGQDWRNARWGKWRPSAEARRQGALATHLERLMRRDGLTFEEAKGW